MWPRLAVGPVWPKYERNSGTVGPPGGGRQFDLGQTSDRLAHLDVGVAVVAEHAELAVEPNAHEGGLQRVHGHRIDDKPARGERLTDRSVGENHGSCLGTGSAQMLPRAPWRRQVACEARLVGGTGQVKNLRSEVLVGPVGRLQVAMRAVLNLGPDGFARQQSVHRVPYRSTLAVIRGSRPIPSQAMRFVRAWR